MRRLLKFELKKVAGKKLFWAFFLTGLILNIFTLWWTDKGDLYTPDSNDYKTVYAQLRPLDSSEKLICLQREKDILDAIRQKENLEIQRANDPDSPFTKSEEKEYASVYSKYRDILSKKLDYREAERKSKVVNEAIDEFDTVMNYPAYLSDIKNKASRLTYSSIFGSEEKNDFSSRNIKKTVKDYENMESVHPKFDINKGINLMLDFPASDFFILMMILVVCLLLISDEKEKGLFALIRATKGGLSRTIAAKLAALFIFVVFISISVCASTALFAEASYGLGDLTRAVQSVPDMISMTVHMKIWQYLLLDYALKVIGLTVIGMVIMMFAISANNSILAITEVILTGAASVCLYRFIPITSGFNWLKILNLTCLANPNYVLSRYCNLDFFGYPVGVTPALLVFTAALMLLLIAVDGSTFIKVKEIKPVRFTFKFVRNFKAFRPFVHSHIAWYEFRKIAGINMAALILAAFVLLQLFTVKNAKVSLTAEDCYYRHYMVMLAGKITPEKELLIQKEKAKFDGVDAEIKNIDDMYKGGKITWDEKMNREASYENILYEKSIFSKIYDRYIYLKTHPGTQFVYDLGYEKLFGITDMDNGLGSGIKLLTALILCLCGAFSIEYETGMFKVLGTAQKGCRDTAACKIGISLMIAFLLFVSAYVPDLILIGKYYGYGGLSAPLASLPAFEHFGISILGYMILLFASRLIVCFGTACIILAVSLLTKRKIYTALISLCTFVGPPLLHMANIRLFDYISFIPLFRTNLYYLGSQKAVISVIQIAAFILLVIISLIFIFRKFTKQTFFVGNKCGQEKTQIVVQ